MLTEFAACARRWSPAVLLILLIHGCSPDDRVQTDPIAFDRLEVEWFETLKRHVPQIGLAMGEALVALPDLSPEGAEALAEEARRFQDLLAEINKEDLPHEEQLTYAMMGMQVQQLIDLPATYYLTFSVTPYNLGWQTSRLIPPYLNDVTIESEADQSVFLSRLHDVARLADQLYQKAMAQTEQGILVPAPALPGVRTIIGNLAPSIESLTMLDDTRLEALSPEQAQAFRTRVERVVNESIMPSIGTLLAHYDEAYERKAPTAVGLHQYAGGAAYYQELIGMQTTLDLSPDSIHQAGLTYQAILHEEMQEIRESLGYEGTAQDFHQQLKLGTQFYLDSPEEVASLFDEYIQRIEPIVDDYFSLKPKAPYGTMRLDPANEAGMTFGYYQRPSPAEPRGLYRFNGSHLDERPMIWAGPLIYHELIPGHHFHLALQDEHPTLSDYRKYGMNLTAFNEGWGNYASSLALEMGLLPDPLERYGWLLFDSFITARLVLDTGMNHFGWTLGEAKAYMLENTFQSEREVMSELLRYSTDMPGQALAYKLGFEHIKDLRMAMEEKYGDQFDIKDFHAAVVGSGALPMPVLTEHVVWFLAEKYN